MEANAGWWGIHGLQKLMGEWVNSYTWTAWTTSPCEDATAALTALTEMSTGHDFFHFCCCGFPHKDFNNWWTIIVRTKVSVSWSQRSLFAGRNADHALQDPALHNWSIFGQLINQDRNDKAIFVTSYLLNSFFFFFFPLVFLGMPFIFIYKLFSPKLFYNFFSCHCLCTPIEKKNDRLVIATIQQANWSSGYFLCYNFFSLNEPQLWWCLGLD